MSLFKFNCVRYALPALFTVMFVSGCSSSSDIDSDDPQSSTASSGDNADPVTSEDGTDTDTDFDTSTGTGTGTGTGTQDIPEEGVNDPMEDTLIPVQASLELVADKTFRINWQSSSGAQFYRVLESSDGLSEFTLISPDLDSSVQSFDRRVALYDKFNARYIVQACNLTDCIDSDVLITPASLETAIGYFKASNNDGNGLSSNVVAAFGDRFGYSMSLSADGMTLAIGAPLEDSMATDVNGDQDDNSLINAGAVYVYHLTDSGWQQQAYLKGTDVRQDINFGHAVSLSADGDTLAVSALIQGVVYIFSRIDGTWEQQDSLTVRDFSFSREPLNAVSLSADGRTLAIGSKFNSSIATGIDGDASNTDRSSSGAVYVFVYNDEDWQQQAFIKGSELMEFDLFGSSVALGANGNTLAVGAPSEDSRAKGKVFVFERTEGDWQEQACLSAELGDPCSVRVSGFGGDRFGVSVSLSADGNSLAVGSSYEGTDAFNSGAVFIYERSGTDWQQQAFVKAGNTDAHDNFGVSVSLNADGNKLAVGAPSEASVASGINGREDNDAIFDFRPCAVYVYALDTDTDQWQQNAYVKASTTDDAGGQSFDNTRWSTRTQWPEGGSDKFGYAVVLSADGETLSVSAPDERSGATEINGDAQDNSVSGAGAVYTY